MALLRTWGWVDDLQEGEAFLVIPPGKYVTMKDFKQIEEQVRICELVVNQMQTVFTCFLNAL
jgi:hypothetical protein